MIFELDGKGEWQLNLSQLRQYIHIDIDIEYLSIKKNVKQIKYETFQFRKCKESDFINKGVAVDDKLEQPLSARVDEL